MPHANSQIITAPREQSSRIGMPGGERGLETSGDTAAAQWLAERTPDQVNESFRSQASRHGIEIRVTGDLHYPANGPVKRVNLVANVNGKVTAIQGFLSTAEKFLKPASNSTIEAWLAELDVITAKRPDDEITGIIRLRAYAKRLSDFPADIARAALLGRTWRFFPTWEELESICRDMLTERRAMIFGLRNFKEPQRVGGMAATVTPEARERIQAELAAFHANNAAAKAEYSLKPSDGADPFDRANQFFSNQSTIGTAWEGSGKISADDPRLAEIPNQGEPQGWQRARVRAA